MFKLIFKTVIITIFLMFVTVALALWRGGEPFRYFGEGVTIVGKSIVTFGDYIDEFKSGSSKIQKHYDKLKDAMVPDDEEVKSVKER
ncbi:MAG: hypothetical protein AB1499_08950 [Nitrospirota bacterium]